MPFTTFAEMKTEVENWLNRSDLTTQIDEFITLAEARINRDFIKKRIRKMSTTADLTVDAQSVALPSDFLQIRRLYLNTSPVRHLEYVTPDVFWKAWAGSSTGKPKVYTIEGTNILFGPTPDDSYTGKLLYYQKIPSLASNDTNWVLVDAPDIYLYASLISAEPYIMNDKRLSTWARLYDEAIDSLELADGEHGGTIAYRAGVAP